MKAVLIFILLSYQTFSQEFFETNVYSTNGQTEELILETTQPNRVVLPNTAQIKHYAVTFFPDIDNLKFTGKINITLLATDKPTKKLVLNAVDLEILKASLHAKDSIQKNIMVNYDKEGETVSFSFGNEIPPHTQAVLQLSYSGLITKDMQGWYFIKSSKPRPMLSSQMQPVAARKVIPCGDEPALKATFDICVVALKGYQVLSNGEKETEIALNDNEMLHCFARTPRMSTYLLAMVVGDFDKVSAKTDGGVIVNIYTSQNQSQFGLFSLDVAVRALDFFEEYFGTKYPLKKLDLVGVAEFSAGAMENWGLCVFRELFLLVDNELSSQQIKQRVSEVVSHELAHQWFGNLVTFKWWNDLWLNEGFATWASALATDKLFPAWETWSEFLGLYVLRAFQLDSMDSTHPLEVEVVEAKQISEIFDTISYNKGSAIVYMLANYLGESQFKNGLNHYLSNLAYKNAETMDLWKSLALASGKDVAGMMKGWSEYPGFPLITVNLSSDKNQITLHQSRFSRSGVVTTKTLWRVPVFVEFTYSDNTKRKELFELQEEQQTFQISHLSGWASFKVNPRQSGYYRVHYEECLSMVSINHQLSIDRLGLQNDLFAIFKLGKIPSSSFLSFLQQFSNENNRIVWQDLSVNLMELVTLMNNLNDKSADLLKEFIHDLYFSETKKIGWDSNADLTKEEAALQNTLRSTLLLVLGLCGDKETAEKSKTLFWDHFNNGKPLLPELRSTVFRIAISSTQGLEVYHKIKEFYAKSNSPEEQVDCLRALGSIKGESLLKETLEWALNEVKTQDVQILIDAIARNRDGRLVCFEYIVNNWDEFESKLGNYFWPFQRAILSSLQYLADSDLAERAKKLFNEKDLPNLKRTITQAIESIELNKKFLDKTSESLRLSLQEWKNNK